jgi:ribosomal protein L7/L12
VISSLIVIIAAAAAMLSAANDSWVGFYISAVCFLLLLIYHKAVTARFRPSNWLVRMSDNGLFIKFRSYLNCHFPADDYTVAYLSYGDILSARRLDEVQQVADRGEDGHPSRIRRKLRWLELELGADTRQLAIALANEMNTVLAKTRIGTEKPSTRYHHFPVQLASAKKLRLEWAVTPKLPVVLERLARHTLVRAEESNLKDFSNLESLSRSEQESRLLAQAESGDKIGAIATARQLYGYDLAQAKKFVEGLAAKQTQN